MKNQVLIIICFILNSCGDSNKSKNIYQEELVKLSLVNEVECYKELISTIKSYKGDENKLISLFESQGYKLTNDESKRYSRKLNFSRKRDDGEYEKGSIDKSYIGLSKGELRIGLDNVDFMSCEKSHCRKSFFITLNEKNELVYFSSNNHFKNAIYTLTHKIIRSSVNFKLDPESLDTLEVNQYYMDERLGLDGDSPNTRTFYSYYAPAVNADIIKIDRGNFREEWRLKSRLYKKIEDYCCHEEYLSSEGKTLVRDHSEKDINYLFQAIDKYSRIKRFSGEEYVLVKNMIPFDAANRELKSNNNIVFVPDGINWLTISDDISFDLLPELKHILKDTYTKGGVPEPVNIIGNNREPMHKEGFLFDDHFYNVFKFDEDGNLDFFEFFNLESSMRFNTKERKPYLLTKDSLKNGFFDGKFISYIKNNKHGRANDITPENRIIEPVYESIFENGELKKYTEYFTNLYNGKSMIHTNSYYNDNWLYRFEKFNEDGKLTYETGIDENGVKFTREY